MKKDIMRLGRIGFLSCVFASTYVLKLWNKVMFPSEFRNETLMENDQLKGRAPTLMFTTWKVKT
jgi:hypothetical protein